MPADGMGAASGGGRGTAVIVPGTGAGAGGTSGITGVGGGSDLGMIGPSTEGVAVSGAVCATTGLARSAAIIAAYTNNRRMCDFPDRFSCR
jgi:hypothetical protein